MLFRCLIGAQVVSIALLGLGVRWGDSAALPTPLGLGVMAAVAISFLPVWVGFPLGVILAERRLPRSRRRRAVLIVVQAILGYATFLAILPAVQ